MGHFRSFKALLESGSLSQLYGSSGGPFAALSRNFVRVLSRAFARIFAQHSRISRGEHASSRHISAEYAFQKPQFEDMMVVSTTMGHEMCTHSHWTPFQQLKCCIRTVMEMVRSIRGMTRDCALR